MNTLPSSAYAARPPMRQATVVSRPCPEATGVAPVFSSTKQPVP